MVKIKSFIEDIGKYHFMIIAGKKIIILSSDNDSTIAKKNAIKKILSKSDKLEGVKVFRLKLVVLSPKKVKEDENKRIPSIGGPIEIQLTSYKIKKGKMVKTSDNWKSYVTKKYLRSKKYISLSDLKKVSYIYSKKMITSGSINTLENISKRLKKN